jgi:ribulose-phosphate 3-epimerase
MKIAASFLNIKEPIVEEVTKLSNLDIDYLHLDVMDGIFVPNITFGDKLVSDLHKEFSTLKLDVHLMTKCPEKKINDYVLAGATTITLHVEETNICKLKKISSI